MTSSGWGIIAVILPLLGAIGIAFLLGAAFIAGQTASLIDELKAEAERAINLVEYRHGEDR
jgi:predicted PurR-regulated permease PerM